MPKSQYAWITKNVNYDLREGKNPLKKQSIRFSDYHPLKPIMVTESIPNKISGIGGRGRRSDSRSDTSSNKSYSTTDSGDFVDPLSALVDSDPLSALAATVTVTPTLSAVEDVSDTKSEYGEDFESWSLRKIKILNKYTMDEKLAALMISVTKNLNHKTGRPTHMSGSITDKLRNRLNQLDDLAEGGIREKTSNSQQEFIDRIQALGQTLIQSWEANQKVNALKVAIQCVKMLSDLTVILYYPSKFVLIADILHTFGELVYSRILSMCGGMTTDTIDPEKVPENAREICINWMLKIASIRELLPRIYIEAAILPCYRFINKGECSSILVRLTNMTRGVGNPLVAVYAKAFLCLTGVKYYPQFKGHFRSNFNDYVATYKQIHTTSVQNQLTHQKMDMPKYLSLFVPALEWILSCIAYKATENTLKDILDKCEKTGNSLLILQCVLSSFKPDCISPRAVEFCFKITTSQDDLFNKSTVFRELGLAVVAAEPPEKDKLILLNDAWKFIVKIEDANEYIFCAEVWTTYAAKYFKKREVNTILSDIIKHMVPDRAFDKHYSKLLAILKKMLENVTDFSSLFTMDKFLPFLDMFQKEDTRVEACKLIALFFHSRDDSSTADPLVINGLIHICKAMHDSINALSLEGERKSISEAICGVIQKITFGRDFEQQLNFYVECRASFRNLDLVLSALVHHVNRLSTKATWIVRRNHTTKTAAFVRACAAYCFITIPSLNDVYLRLSLYLVSAQAALINHCIAQADAMLCAAVSQLLEFQSYISKSDSKFASAEGLLMSYMLNFVSTLLAVPDNPEQGILCLLRGFLNVISQSGEQSSLLMPESRLSIYIKVLSLLSAYSQDKYLYRIENVDSNEDLYSGNKTFIGEINNISSTLLDEILAFLTTPSNSQAKRSNMAMELFSTIYACCDLQDKSMQTLAMSVWSIISESNQANKKNLENILKSMKYRGGVYKEVANQLKLPET